MHHFQDTIEQLLACVIRLFRGGDSYVHCRTSCERLSRLLAVRCLPQFAQQVLRQLTTSCSTSRLRKLVEAEALEVRDGSRPQRTGKLKGRRGPGFATGQSQEQDRPT